MEWAKLEFGVDFMLGALIPLKYGFPDNESFHCIVVSADMGSKIQMIRGIAFAKRISFYDDLMSVLNEVHNKMRLRRNRLVHDVWSVEDGKNAARMQRVISITHRSVS